MKRIVMILISVWVLLGAPVLCVSGVLVHACACGTVCEHESDCDVDPCNVFTVRASRSDAEEVQIQLAETALVDLVVTTDFLSHEPDGTPVETSPLGVPNLGQPASGLPLLC